MKIGIALLGASGFVGAELLRLLAAHPVLHAARLFADSNAGGKVAGLYPSLTPFYPDQRFDALSELDFEGVGLVMAALPHGESQKLAPRIVESGLPFVDLGADFRLRDADSYRQWYHEPHLEPDLLGDFVYGLPEITRDRIKGAKLVAAPGCYPTSAILALKPLLDAGLIEPNGIIVDAASGVSGAGRGLKHETSFCTVDESFSAYGLLNHRHTAEMEQELGAQVLFTPHLAPISRGILATCYATATRTMGAEEPLDALKAAYSGERFVQAVDAPPSTKSVQGSNSAFVTARYDPRTGRVVAISAIDNLVKGAAGQMIQCANLMLGLDEGLGLPVCGMFP